MNADWKVEKAQYAEFNVPTCGKIAVWQLCRERQRLWNSHDGLNLRCLDQCHGVRSHGTSSSQGWRKRIVVQSKFDPWVYILVFAEDDVAGLPRKAFSQKQAFVDISVFLWLRKQRPRFAQGQPKGYFQNWKNFIEQLKLILKWMLIERWRRLSMLSSMCQHVARLQFDSCAEKDSLCGTVMIHDGLNLRCLDQCHGVRSHGSKLLPRLAQTIVVQSKSGFDPWVYILFSPCFKMIYAGLPWWIQHVFLWLRKQQPRFAQGQPKGYFQLKELHRTTKPYSQMNPDWKVGKAQYAEFNVPTCGKIAVWQVCRERQPLWNTVQWWPELDMFGSMPYQCHRVRSHGKSSSQG